MKTQHDDSLPGAPLVGDHLALDLLNTQASSNGAALEFWNSGDDVLRWLARCGVTPAEQGAVPDLPDLLSRALALRTLARRLLAERAEGESGDVSALNAWLDAYLSAPHLGRNAEGKLVLSRVARGDAIASLLGPVAEALADLLAHGDFALVKQCEHPDCILWFYDRTKAHKRRWCSMALCGNRYKAAQFRKKSSASSASS